MADPRHPFAGAGGLAGLAEVRLGTGPQLLKILGGGGAGDLGEKATQPGIEPGGQARGRVAGQLQDLRLSETAQAGARMPHGEQAQAVAVLAGLDAAKQVSGGGGPKMGARPVAVPRHGEDLRPALFEQPDFAAGVERQGDVAGEPDLPGARRGVPFEARRLRHGLTPR